jgi:hypothetical protein
MISNQQRVRDSTGYLEAGVLNTKGISKQAEKVSVELRGRIVVPLSPSTYSSNLFKPHVRLNAHSSCGPFTNTHPKHCAANSSSARFHLYTDDTGTRKKSGQPTPIKTCCVTGPPYPLQQGTQRFTRVGQFKVLPRTRLTKKMIDTSHALEIHCFLCTCVTSAIDLP